MINFPNKKTKTFSDKSFSFLAAHKKRAGVFVLLIVVFSTFFNLFIFSAHATPISDLTPDQIATIKAQHSPGDRYYNDIINKLGQNADSSDLIKELDAAMADVRNSEQQQANGTTSGTAALNTSAADSWTLKLILSPVIFVLFIISYLMKCLVGLSGSLLDMTLNPALYNNFTGSLIIAQGWTIVRDLCNMLFLLVLLFIAFCTILQIEKYHVKKTLLTLIIMALLINFSKPIAIFIFDGSQLLMNMFLLKLANGNASPSSMYNMAAGIAQLLYNRVDAFTDPNSGAVSIALQYLLSIIFLFMLFVAFIVIAIFLLIRIVAIMVLIIVSPFAFLASAVPDFNSMSNKWWNALFKYAYFGPTAAFFLLLAASLNTSLPKLSGSLNTSMGDATVTANLVKGILDYTVTIVFLYASIIMAQQFGIQFASSVTGWANKALRYGTGLAAAQWGGRKAWQGAKYAGRGAAKWGERALLMPKKEGQRNWSPRAWIQSWKEQAEEQDRRALGLAKADSRDKINNVLRPREKSKNYHKDLAQAQLEEEMGKELELIGDANLNISEIKKNLGKKDRVSQARVASAMKQLFKKNDQNDYSIDKMKDGKMTHMDQFTLKKALAEDLESTGMSKHQIGKALNSFGNIALMSGNVAHHGMGEFNATSGEFEPTSDSRQLDIIGAKVGTMESQGLTKILHPDSLFVRGADGKLTYDLHDAGKVIFSKMDAGRRKQFDRFRGDTAEAAYQAQTLGKFADAINHPIPGRQFSDVEINNILESGKRSAETYGASASAAVRQPRPERTSAVYNNEYPDPYA